VPSSTVWSSFAVRPGRDALFAVWLGGVVVALLLVVSPIQWAARIVGLLVLGVGVVTSLNRLRSQAGVLRVSKDGAVQWQSASWRLVGPPVVLAWLIRLRLIDEGEGRRTVLWLTPGSMGTAEHQDLRRLLLCRTAVDGGKNGL